MFDLLPAGWVLLFGSLLIPWTKGTLRFFYLLLLPLANLLHVALISKGTIWSIDSSSKLGFGFTDTFSTTFTLLFSLVVVLAGIYMLHRRAALEFTSGYFYVGAAIGVVTALDRVSFFVCWELLTIAGTLIILSRGTRRSYNAGFRYLFFHVLGGLCLMTGLLVDYAQTGSLEIVPQSLGTFSAVLIFLGLGVNAAWPFFHTWVPDAYPEASEGGAVLLSAITTKCAVFALIRWFPGESSLIWIGTAMAVFPLIFAAVEKDLRRVLAYCLLNPLGFMLVAVGIGTPFAIDAAVAHVVAHVFYKSLLFMALGAVLLRIGSCRVADIQKAAVRMPLTSFFGVLGALAISAPFFGAYVSKGMIMAAVEKAHLTNVWWVLLASAGGVFVFAGVRVVHLAFFNRSTVSDVTALPDDELRDTPFNMKIAMCLAVCVSLAIGVFPKMLLVPLLPSASFYNVYTMGHVLSQLQLLFVVTFLYLFLARNLRYPGPQIKGLYDIDYFYKRLLRFWDIVFSRFLNGFNAIADSFTVDIVVKSLGSFFSNAPSRISMAIMLPVWNMAGYDTTQVQEHQESLRKAMRVGSLPLGLGVLHVVGLLFVLFVLTVV